MDALQHSLATTAGPLLVAGCAMIALGASALVTAALLWFKRRRPSTPPAEPSAQLVDRYDTTPAPAPVASVDSRRLRHIDRRLEELEVQLAALAERVDTVLRPRAEVPTTRVRPTVVPKLEVVDAAAPTPEELSLRALVARGH